MANWSISPPLAHSNNGVFDFPKNTGTTDMIYTVSYSSDTNCTASTTYIVPTCPTGDCVISLSFSGGCNYETGVSQLIVKGENISCGGDLAVINFTVTQGAKTANATYGIKHDNTSTINLNGLSAGQASVTWKLNSNNSISGSTTVTLPSCNTLTVNNIYIYVSNRIGNCTNSSLNGNQYRVWLGGADYATASELRLYPISIIGYNTDEVGENRWITVNIQTLNEDMEGHYVIYPKGSRGSYFEYLVCDTSGQLPITTVTDFKYAEGRLLDHDDTYVYKYHIMLDQQPSGA